MNFLRALFKIPAAPPKRYVLLCNHHDEIKIVEAKQSQAGWIANYWEHVDDSWVVLLPDGTIKGTSIISSWMPHSGWDGTEFQENIGTIKMMSE